MINVIDEVLNTGATDNKIKYTLTHQDGTTELVQIDLATPVTTQGTAINRALFEQVNDFVSISAEPVNINCQGASSGSGVITRSTTITTNGRRYVLIVWTSASSATTISLLDCKTKKFAMNVRVGYISSTAPTQAIAKEFNVTEATMRYDNSGGTMKATFNYENKLITLNFTINATSHTVSGQPGIAFELGGFID